VPHPSMFRPTTPIINLTASREVLYVKGIKACVFFVLFEAECLYSDSGIVIFDICLCGDIL